MVHFLRTANGGVYSKLRYEEHFQVEGGNYLIVTDTHLICLTSKGKQLWLLSFACVLLLTLNLLDLPSSALTDIRLDKLTNSSQQRVFTILFICDKERVFVRMI